MNLILTFTFAALLLSPLSGLHAADVATPAVHTVTLGLQPKIQFLNRSHPAEVQTAHSRPAVDRPK